MLRLFASALVALALVTGTALAAKGGPAPGVSVGWDGTVDSSGAVRYVALPAASTTTIAAVRTSDGRVLRYGTIRGVFGIPLVAFDGTAEGVSRDGKTLLLADVAARPEQTHFAVLRTANFRVAKTADAPRSVGVRRPVAGRSDALCNPVPRHGREPAVSGAVGQPRQR